MFVRVINMNKCQASVWNFEVLAVEKCEEYAAEKKSLVRNYFAYLFVRKKLEHGVIEWVK